MPPRLSAQQQYNMTSYKTRLQLNIHVTNAADNIHIGIYKRLLNCT